MKFKQFYNQLDEKFMDATVDRFDRYYELSTDPISKTEILNVIKNSSYGTVRMGISDSPKPKTYMWDGTLLHNHAKKEFNINFEVGIEYSKKNPRSVTIFGMTSKAWVRDHRNHKAILETIYGYFPQANKIEFQDKDMDFKKMLANAGKEKADWV